MLNVTQVLIEFFVPKLKAAYQQNYGGLKPEYAEIIGWAASMSLENIANSDALYHNVEHTILVTQVGQEILRCKHIRDGGVSPEDWLHFIISLLCHDIGYVKGVCMQDKKKEGSYIKNEYGEMVTPLRGSTDAWLTPYHVDRGKLFVEQRFENNQLADAIDVVAIKRNIELTRFPVPAEDDYQDTKDYPGLVRAADLIGQLSDPRYLKKHSALFYEFEETGVNQNLGYKTPGELREKYPTFYRETVFPYIKDAIDYLRVTQEGQQIIANLFSNVFVIEQEV